MLIYLQMIETETEKSKFVQIYESYHKLAYHIAFKYLDNEQDAEDAVHHAFEKVAINIKKVDLPCPKTKEYIVTIIENRSIDLLRARSRHPMAEFSEELFAVPPPPDSGDLLVQCILKLPALQRQVLWLKYVDGYSLREIGKMLDISLAWAQKIDQRAKKQLEILYKEAGGNL